MSDIYYIVQVSPKLQTCGYSRNKEKAAQTSKILNGLPGVVTKVVLFTEAELMELKE